MVHPSGEQQTVLIVEDEAIVAEDLSYKVKALGYNVVGVFPTGEQAILAAQQSSIDLVLLDIQLGGTSDGIETAKKLQQVCDPAIVFTTAHSDPQTLNNANATDPHGYILKPFGERDLAVQLAIALHKHRADRALRKAEEHIRRKEAELEVIISRTPFLLTRCNRDLRYQFVSRAYAAMLGRSPEDIAGKPIVDIMGNMGFQTILPYITRVLNGESVTYETEVEFKNIGKRWLEAHYWPDTDVRGNVVGWIASILDVTERKNAEDRLRESERRFREMADTAPVLIWLSDTTKLCTWFNRPWLEFTGRTMKQELGNGWADSVHAEDLNRCLDIYTSSFDQRLPFSMEYRLRRHDGAYRWILDRGTPRYAESGEFLGYIGSCIDVTERKQHEEAVEMVALFPAQNPSPVLRIDPAGVLLYMNPASDRLLGGLHLRVGQSVPADLRDLVEHTLQSGRPEDVEYDIGSCHYLVCVTPLVKEHYANLYWTDITERKRAQSAEQRRSGQLQLLYELASAVNRGEELNALYDTALDAIISSLKAHRASILLFDHDGVMKFQAWRGLSDRYRLAVEGHSPWQSTQTEPPPIILQDVATSDIEPHLRATILEEGIRALAFIPLCYGGRQIGKFTVYFDQPRIMNGDELEVAKAIATTLATGIERKQAEEELRESEERLRMAMTAGEMGAWDINMLTDTVTWDAKQHEILGCGSGQAPSTMGEFYAMVHPDDVQRVKDAALITEATGQFSEDFRIVRPDGHVRWIAGKGAILKDREKRPIRMVGVNYDITGRKNAEQALHESEERLQLAQERLKRWALELEEAVTIKTAELVQSQERLRALATEINLAEQRERQRLATELHDHLQQLLVLGKLHLGQGKQHAAGIPACANVMKQVDGLLGDALQYTRTLVAELSPSVLRDHGLAAGLKWLGEYMKKYDMAVTVTVPETEVALPKDQVVLLFQSVRELLINSWKHAGSAVAQVNLSHQNAMLSITVSDQGKGFDLAAAAAAADTPNGGLSSKFGLFNVSERMKALGGSFDIQSSLNRGTTILLTLPLSPCPERTPAGFVVSRNQNEPPSEECSTTHRSARIRCVLVDDHIMVRQGLKVVLEGYPDVELVGEAADGEEAVAVVSRVQPDVVVMDINMPRKNGIEATRAMKARHPGVTVIGISVNTSHDDEQAMLKAGAIRLLNKESAVEHLHKAIREAAKAQAVLPLSNPSAATILLVDGHKQDREYWAERLRVSSPEFVVLEAETGRTALEICNSHRVDCVVVEAELPDMSGFKVLLKSIGDAARQEKPVIVLSRLNLESLRELAMKHGAFAYLMKSQVSGDDLDRTIRKALASVGSTQKERVS
jgi:PAS domain S-box-containing protein